MNEAAVMLIINQQGLILSVSRKSNPNKFGLPGGKLEKDEHPKIAAVRETREETSIIVSNCLKIYSRVEPKENETGEDFNTHCFYATEWYGTPVDSEEGKVMWLTSKDLTSSQSGAFPEYNKLTLNKFKKLFPNIKVV